MLPRCLLPVLRHLPLASPTASCSRAAAVSELRPLLPLPRLHHLQRRGHFHARVSSLSPQGLSSWRSVQAVGDLQPPSGTMGSTLGESTTDRARSSRRRRPSCYSTSPATRMWPLSYDFLTTLFFSLSSWRRPAAPVHELVTRHLLEYLAAVRHHCAQKSTLKVSRTCRRGCPRNSHAWSPRTPFTESTPSSPRSSSTARSRGPLKTT